MYDLSIVTDTLCQLLTAAVSTSPLWPPPGHPPFSWAVTGQHPEELDGDTDCDLNLYLYHVGIDKFLRNQFWAQQNQSVPPKATQPVAYEPLCLDLWYVLSARSRSSYIREQQMLGIAMHAFHRSATVQLNVLPPSGPAVTTEVSLVPESPTFDELSRLWQALGVPLRTTAQYRVSVAFLTLDEPADAAPEVREAPHVLAAPAALGGDPKVPALVGTRRTVTYLAPTGPFPGYDQAPASTAPAPDAVAGQQFTISGAGLAATDQVTLVSFAPDGTQASQDVTDWKVADALPMVLRPPAAAGACPPPGRYELRVSHVGGDQSAGVPLDIAPWVNPDGGPLLDADVNDVYTCQVVNAAAAGLTVRLGTAVLTPSTTPAVGAGEWALNGGTLIFRAPEQLPAGQYPVVVQVDGVDCDPAKWVQL